MSMCGPCMVVYCVLYALKYSLPFHTGWKKLIKVLVSEATLDCDSHLWTVSVSYQRQCSLNSLTKWKPHRKQSTDPAFSSHTPTFMYHTSSIVLWLLIAFEMGCVLPWELVISYVIVYRGDKTLIKPSSKCDCSWKWFLMTFRVKSWVHWGNCTVGSIVCSVRKAQTTDQFTTAIDYICTVSDPEHH